MADIARTGEELHALAQRVAAVQTELDRLVKEKRKGSIARGLLFLALVAFVGVTLYAFYNLYRERTSPQGVQELTSQLQKRFNANSDDYTRQVRTMIERAAPVWNRAIAEQARKDLPQLLEGVDAQREELRQGLGDKLSARMGDSFEKALSRHEQELKAEFPAFDNQVARRRMIKNLSLAARGVSRKYCVPQLQAEVKTLYDRWDQFPLADPPKKGAEPLEDQLTASLYQPMVLKLTYSEALASDRPPRQ
jgi:hypothetical protein